MATIKERLALLVTADVDGATRELDKLGRQSQRDIGRAASSADKLGASLTKVGAAMMSVGAVGAVGLVKAADAAAELEQQTRRAETTFKSAFSTIETEAKGAATALGLSERAYLDAASSIALYARQAELGDEETARFSESIIDMARDAATFAGVGLEDAIDRIGAAFRGEADPAEQLGLNLKITAVQAEAVALGLGKVTQGSPGFVAAMESLIAKQMEASGAAGFHADNMDLAAVKQQEFKAQLENLQAAIGETLLPILNNLVSGASDLLGAFNRLDPATKKMVSLVATLGTGVALVGGGMLVMVGQVVKARSALAKFNITATSTAGKLGIVATALAAVVWEHQQAKAELEGLEAEFQQMSDTLNSNRNDYDLLSQQLREVKERFADIDRADLVKIDPGDVRALEQAIDDATAAVARARTGAEQGRREWDRYKGSVDGVTEGTWDADEAVGEMGRSFDTARTKISSLKERVDAFLNESLGRFRLQTDAVKLLEDLTGAGEDFADMTDGEVRRALEGFTERIGGLQADSAELGVNMGSDLAKIDTAMLGLMIQAQNAGIEVDDVGRALQELDGLTATVRLELDVPPGFQLGNIDAPSGTGMSGPTGTIQIPVYLDGTEVATAVAEADYSSGTVRWGPR